MNHELHHMSGKFLAKLLAEKEYFRLSNTVKSHTCSMHWGFGDFSSYKLKT